MRTNFAEDSLGSAQHQAVSSVSSPVQSSVEFGGLGALLSSLPTISLSMQKVALGYLGVFVCAISISLNSLV